MTLKMKFSKLFSYFLVLIISWNHSLQAQNFDSLINELSGSESDQIESEIVDTKKEKKELPSSTEMVSPLEDDTFAQEENTVTKGVTLQGLDKQTARVFIIDAPIEKPIEFGTLRIVVHRCEKAPREDRQESMAFLTISDNKPNDTPKQVFSGWMFASSPALSCLDHPVYDVWVKECKNVKAKK